MKTEQELQQKDFQLATLKLLLHNNALLRTVVESQISIISKLEEVDGATVTRNMNEFIEENKAIAYKMLQEAIPGFRFAVKDINDLK